MCGRSFVVCTLSSLDCFTAGYACSNRCVPRCAKTETNFGGRAKGLGRLFGDLRCAAFRSDAHGLSAGAVLMASGMNKPNKSMRTIFTRPESSSTLIPPGDLHFYRHAQADIGIQGY
jgi:hypothetical protein